MYRPWYKFLNLHFEKGIKLKASDHNVNNFFFKISGISEFSKIIYTGLLVLIGIYAQISVSLQYLIGLCEFCKLEDHMMLYITY
jgi:hypothetical protein